MSTNDNDGQTAGMAAERSPVTEAEDAKRTRNLLGELEALGRGVRRLTEAPWYPVRPGDLVHHAYPPAGDFPGFGETYIVSGAETPGLLSMQLLAHTLPGTAERAEGMVGCFAVDADPDPLVELWMEAGPHALTIVRDGLVVHAGGASQTLADVRRYLERGEPAAALARITTGAPLPPCGAVGPMPEHEPCGRWAGHGGAHSPGADLPDPPHVCPALPDALYAVVRLTAGRVRVTGTYAAEGAADAAAEEFPAYTRARSAELVAVTRGGHSTIALPPGAATVVIPVRLRPDPRRMDAWDLGAEDVRDYGDDVRDHE